MSNVKLTAEVTNVLKRSTIDGNVLILPSQLDRSLYEQVNKALVAAGGKWKRNMGGHVFDGDPMAKLGLALDTGIVVDEKKAFQAFYTPPELAKRVVELADVRNGHNVLEPSAGVGALLKELPAGAGVMAVELNPEAVEKLRALKRGVVFCDDFMDWDCEYQFHRVVMNPPFAKNQDVKHVSRALDLLKPGGVLVAIMSPNIDRACFKQLVEDLDYDLFDVEEGTFEESGTDIKTVILRVRK